MTNETKQSLISGAFLIGSIILTYFLTKGSNAPSYVGGDNAGRDNFHIETPTTYNQLYIEKYEDKQKKSDIHINGDMHGDINMNDGDVVNGTKVEVQNNAQG